MQMEVCTCCMVLCHLNEDLSHFAALMQSKAKIVNLGLKNETICLKPKAYSNRTICTWTYENWQLHISIGGTYLHM